ncbi:MAG: PAS domain S-box protein, partial [Alphaproteobacteria bacterium]|nr:PAS domain S-box protein [Alphaproteobacteria bacterium]
NALRENEKRYLEMFNRAQVGLARKRISDGKLLEANERIAEIYGYESREEMLVEIDPASHWLDTASREEVMAEGPQSGGSYEIEAQHVRKDGATIWVRLSTNYFPELDYVEITNVDITEQKLAEQALHESEDRYRALSDLTSEGVAILEDGVIVEANQAFARMYGYTVSELVGKPVLELTIPEHSQEVADRMKENRSDTYESVSFRKDGSKIPIEIKAAPFVYKGRQMRVSRMRDLTEAHKAAAAVRDSEERLRQAQKIEAVGQLTGGIAHDFNNILAAVIGNLDLVKDDTIADLSDKEAIETALDAALRGAELTHRLLAFSRQQALDARDTQINEILPRFLQLATRTIGANIAVETKLADGLDRTMIDVGQHENALLNLVINARDAMPEGGRLTIETANQVLTEDDTAMYEDLQPGDYVMVAVGDDGCGMPGEVREKAFEPFYTTKDVGAGSGLGLSMVFGFARQSGGQVMIDSEEGKGTRVRVYLPRLRPGASVEHPVEEVEQGKLEGKETILVVEDESDVLAYLVRALGGLGYTVLQAEDGPTALEVMAVCGSIDLLLTDVILPRGMNGRDVANAFRARNPGAAVLYSSGYTRDVLDDRGQLDDGVMLINKPFRPRALARQVREILDSRK